MSGSDTPPVVEVGQTLVLGSRVVDLATRALVVAVVPAPRFGREAEVLAAVAAAAEAGADVVEVPGEPRLLGPAAGLGTVPVAVRVDRLAAGRAALAAGAAVLLVPDGSGLVPVDEPELAGRAAVVVDQVAAGRAALAAEPHQPVALDVTRWAGAEAIARESLALAVGLRLIRTTDIRRTRRVVEVMAHLLEARRNLEPRDLEPSKETDR